SCIRPLRTFASRHETGILLAVMAKRNPKTSKAGDDLKPRGTPQKRALRSRIVQVGITQMACGDDVRDNLNRQLRLLEQAAKNGAQILCTQELFRSKYFCQCEDHRFFDL